MDGKDKIGTLKLLLQREAREIDVGVKEGQTLIDVLREASLPLDGVLIFDDSRPIPLDSFAGDFHALTVINVSSGG